uniref:Uncharacterized protein n=1 Tax=Plectus sambesii TaxID=2011161 RepID=A0A914WY17_9BILA
MRKGKGRGRSKKKKETTIELPLLQKTENERTSDTNSAQATSNAETSLMPYSGAQARDEPDANAIINYTKGDTHSIDPNGQQNFFHNHQNQGRMVGGPVHGTVNQGDHHYNLHVRI